MATNLVRQTSDKNIYRSDWGDDVDLERWLKDEILVGDVLNFPCGQSTIGDVKADNDPEHGPDIIADLHNIPFENNSFDTVYCDPPYHFYGGEQYYFIHPLWALAKKRLVLQTNKVSVRVKGAEKSIYTVEYRANHPNLTIFQVFDQPNTTLNEYNE